MNRNHDPQEFAELDFKNAVELNQRRRIHARRPKPVRHLINDIITRRGIAAEQANHELQHAWDAAAGIDIANQSRIGSVRRGVLEIIVDNSSLLQMVSFDQDRLLEKINHQLRKAEITRLRFRVGSIN